MTVRQGAVTQVRGIEAGEGYRDPEARVIGFRRQVQYAFQEHDERYRLSHTDEAVEIEVASVIDVPAVGRPYQVKDGHIWFDSIADLTDYHILGARTRGEAE